MPRHPLAAAPSAISCINSTFDDTQSFVHDLGGKGGLDDVVLAFDETGNVAHRYLHGPAIDELFADESAVDGILWALSDRQGTVQDWAEYDSGGVARSVRDWPGCLSNKMPRRGRPILAGVAPTGYGAPQSSFRGGPFKPDRTQSAHASCCCRNPTSPERTGRATPREYEFTCSDGKRILIQDHSAGHPQWNIGPHFNVRLFDNPRNSKIPGTRTHYFFGR